MHDLGTLGAVQQWQWNQRGWQCGGVFAPPSGTGPIDAFLYAGGSMHDLGKFGGISAEAKAINVDGVIIANYLQYTNGTGPAFSQLLSITRDQ